MEDNDIYRRKHSNKKSNTGVLRHAAQKNRRKVKYSNRWQIVYDRRDKLYRIVHIKISPSEYVIYSVLNTDANMGLGTAILMITHSILGLYDKLADDQVKNTFINEWKKSGKKILLLRGYNHKHLKYIEKEAKLVSIGTHALYHANERLAVSVFGKKEEIEDIFDGLSCIR